MAAATSSAVGSARGSAIHALPSKELMASLRNLTTAVEASETDNKSVPAESSQFNEVTLIVPDMTGYEVRRASLAAVAFDVGDVVV